MIFFMLTNILDESTELLMVGDADIPAIIESAFHVTPEEDSAYLKGIVSRKKQLIPNMLTGIQAVNAQ